MKWRGHCGAEHLRALLCADRTGNQVRLMTAPAGLRLSVFSFVTTRLSPPFGVDEGFKDEPSRTFPAGIIFKLLAFRFLVLRPAVQIARPERFGLFYYWAQAFSRVLKAKAPLLSFGFVADQILAIARQPIILPESSRTASSVINTSLRSRHACAVSADTR